MTHWMGHIWQGKPVPEPLPPPPVSSGTVWCSSCDRDTRRDPLPGSSSNFGPIPAFYFCTFCGVWDADYLPEEDVA
jgi:hypothetical protein